MWNTYDRNIYVVISFKILNNNGSTIIQDLIPRKKLVKLRGWWEDGERMVSINFTMALIIFHIEEKPLYVVPP